MKVDYDQTRDYGGWRCYVDQEPEGEPAVHEEPGPISAPMNLRKRRMIPSLMNLQRQISPPGAPVEKLILGFECAELAATSDIAYEEKPGRESWFYLLDQARGFDFDEGTVKLVQVPMN